MYADIKTSFIQKMLAQYMRDVIEAMRREIIKRGVRETDQLLRSLSYNVYQQQTGGEAVLSFAEWGRYIDMGVGKGHPLGGVKSTTEFLKDKQKKSIRKPIKIYSPIAYGKLNGLIGDLMYGYTEETIAIIKKELDANAQHSKATL